MTRFAEKFGANKHTLFGLSGLGDLILTCGSNNSRNTKFGIKIIHPNMKIFLICLFHRKLLKDITPVEAVYNIAKGKKIDMPIMKQFII